MITSSHQDLVRALPGDKGNISHSLQTLEARGLIVISRSPGGKAESLWLTPEGQKWASQLTGSCDEETNRVAAMGCSACNRLYRAPAPLSAEGSSKIASEVEKRVRNVSYKGKHGVMFSPPGNCLAGSAAHQGGMRQHSQTIPASAINLRSFYLQLLIPIHQMESHFPRGIRTGAHTSY